jgi:hypothetical protein
VLDVESRGHALIIANYDYEDERLRTLTSPQSDASALSRVLGDPQIGDFAVHSVINQPHFVVRREIDGFFRNRSRDDLLLLYFSGHGVKDEDGNLYLATTDTRRDWLSSTAVEAEFVHRAMERSLSRRQILILDCCYSGAFGRNLLAKSDDSIATGEQFGGRGRVVLTASDAVQFAFEGDAAVDVPASIFTSALVGGLETGEADLDRDGFIDVDEWYSYVHDRVTAAMPNQRPSKWSLDVRGSLIVAHNRHADPIQIGLPAELLEAMRSSFAGVREGSVAELAKLLDSHDARLARAAKLALQRLADDDSRRVSAAAMSTIAGGVPASTGAGGGRPNAPDSSNADVDAQKGAAPAGSLDSQAETLIPDNAMQVKKGTASASPGSGGAVAVDQPDDRARHAGTAQAARAPAQADAVRLPASAGATTEYTRASIPSVAPPSGRTTDLHSGGASGIQAAVRVPIARDAGTRREVERHSAFRRLFLLYHPRSFGGGIAQYFYWFIVAPWTVLVIFAGIAFAIPEIAAGESLGFVLFSLALWITPNLLVMLILRHVAQRNRAQRLQQLAEASVAATAAPVTTVGCPSCGTGVPVTALFCPGCGEPRTLIRTRLEAEARRSGVAYHELLREMKDDAARNPMTFDDWKARASAQTTSEPPTSSKAPGGS